MNMYATPVEGIYTIKTPDFQGGFFIEQVKVKVLGETAKSLLIKLSCAVGNHRGGDCMTVRRHNVKMPPRHEYVIRHRPERQAGATVRLQR